MAEGEQGQGENQEWERKDIETKYARYRDGTWVATLNGKSGTPIDLTLEDYKLNGHYLEAYRLGTQGGDKYYFTNGKDVLIQMQADGQPVDEPVYTTVIPHEEETVEDLELKLRLGEPCPWLPGAPIIERVFIAADGRTGRFRGRTPDKDFSDRDNPLLYRDQPKLNKHQMRQQ